MHPASKEMREGLQNDLCVYHKGGKAEMKVSLKRRLVSS